MLIIELIRGASHRICATSCSFSFEVTLFVVCVQAELRVIRSLPALIINWARLILCLGKGEIIKKCVTMDGSCLFVNDGKDCLTVFQCIFAPV